MKQGLRRHVLIRGISQVFTIEPTHILIILSVIVLKGKAFAIYKRPSDRTKEEGEVSLPDFSKLNSILVFF